MLALLLFANASAAEPVTLRWLGHAAPAAPNGVTWGVPWPKGALQKTDALALTTADGRSVPVQTWPLAFWPDGSVKWSGHAIAATADLGSELRLAAGAPAPPATPIRIVESDESVDIDTGAARVRLAKRGLDFVESITVGQRTVAERGRLTLRLEDRTGLEGPKFDSTEGVVEKVTIEQRGPVHAVVKVEGHLAGKSLVHAPPAPWLPFTVRFQFFAGSGAIRLTHTFVYDGAPSVDLIKGIGLSFQIHLQEELHNRHLRFAGDADGGVWAQPVQMLPGYRPQAGRAIADLYAKHLAGERVPNLAELDARTREAIATVPLWSEAKLSQLSSNGWSLHKRTSFVYPWLHVTDGKRARGFALMGDVSGSLGIGVKDFWQKAPKSFELREAHTSGAASMTVWLWSPEAPAMELGRYDEVPHGLAINYEDWKPGWGTAHGIAHTHDLTLWACDKIPANEQVVAMAREAAEPPLLVCAPEYYHAQRALGRWSLPDRSTPTLRWLEGEIEGLVDYYRAQVEERSWYGFWDFGDIMHNYDFGRHEWRYDVGGWAWANTELMPDMLLWYSFLRTGRADYFRFAEAMTRHTSEVDVHHVGPFAPLGSRHNVNHWGDGAKQPRVSHAGLKRFYYFLSGGDGRTGDLLREQIDADLTYAYLAQFNPSHYVPTPDGGARLERAGSPDAPRPEKFAARPTAAERKPTTRFGLEWMCYALNWTTEWERGGDQTWRTRLEADMKTMAANLDAQGRFPGRYFDMIFGGPENMWEMEPMYELPEFWRAWANTCEAVGRQVEGSQMTGPRMLAYAAHVKRDAELGRMAWEKLIGPRGKLPPVSQPKKFSGPAVLRPVTDPAFLGAPVGWQLHGVASVQWALNAIETIEFAKPWLADWEKP